MRLLSRLEDERSCGASWSTYFVRIPKYRPDDHQLIRTASDERRKQRERAAWNQDWVSENAVLIVFTSVDSRTTLKTSRRGIGYVHIEAGHAAQNVLLQAQALGLGSTVVRTFDDEFVTQLLALPWNERVLYFMPTGMPR